MALAPSVWVSLPRQGAASWDRPLARPQASGVCQLDISARWVRCVVVASGPSTAARRWPPRLAL
eukprot:7538816-Alexandrium_andersonii.AAC.1